ncbi:LAME_0D04236g1_1 [Lachancea meyersii CBS 8951]|uniref:LAME_0D04236g1_1 n=1 Tax=Lachancea meyersii CBS 8951 TaxID=1266667 RepID=A0A1G4J848_9SACH|nr:LAME_0D04236g1_1 [Lachancea meyersii CBS 8951]
MSELAHNSPANQRIPLDPKKAGDFADNTSNVGFEENKDTPSETEGISHEKIPNIEDFRPLCTSKSHVYTMHELMEIAKSVSGTSQATLSVHIPKKSFWRLTNRHPDLRQSELNNNTGNGHKNNSGFRLQDFNGDKKNHRTKNARNAKRGGKFAKGDKPYVEEKDVQVNNDELLALEEEIKPTGNSITDFENWRKKMKELERQKKGQSTNNSSDNIERPSLANNGSSISDFFNLNRQSSSNFEELEPQDSLESSKGSHSRFSSFFNAAGPAGTKNESFSTLAQPPTPKDSESRPAAGSRILSFFDNMESRKTAAEQTPQQSTASIPSVSPPPVQEQTNSHFFQGLLNRGKVSSSPKSEDRQFSASDSAVAGAPATIPYSPSGNDQSRTQEPQRSRAPPGLSKIPGNNPMIPPQGPPGYPMGIPMNMFGQNAQPMSQPPAAFQQFHMPPPGVAMHQPFFNNQRQTGERDEKNIRTLKMQLPFIPGPPNMPPPGFPSMHGMPPGISQDMPMPMNNMMPPPPGFFTSQGPSIPQHGNQKMHQHAPNGQEQQQGMRPREAK